MEGWEKLVISPKGRISKSSEMGDYKHLLFDLEGMTHIEKKDLETLLNLRRSHTISLCHLHPNVQTLLELTNLQSAFHTYTTKNEALRADPVQKNEVFKRKKNRWIYWRKKVLWSATIQISRGIKRVMDLLVASSLMVLTLPLFLLAALTIKLYDLGPILYVTDRIGKGGKTFRFPKLRTMYVGSETKKGSLLKHNQHKEGITFKMREDPRITPIGRFLRKTSLDELPQLWTVLRGTMSLVGPRPPLPEEVAGYTLEQRKRLEVKPGITCIWQVSGRSEIPFNEQCKLDLQYIESQSFTLDLLLLLKTIPAVIMGKGAY